MGGSGGSWCAPPSGRWGALRPRRANGAAHPARALRPRLFMQIWRAAQPMGARRRRCIYSRYLRSRASRSRREPRPGPDLVPGVIADRVPDLRHRPPVHTALAKASPARGFTLTPFRSHPLRAGAQRCEKAFLPHPHPTSLPPDKGSAVRVGRETR